MSSLSTPFPLSRRYDLDWLRVLAFTLLIFYHTGMFFVTWGWHVKNKEIAEWMEIPMMFLSQWRMPLLFLISGAGVYFALKGRTKGHFIRERLVRLLVPLVFGMFVVVPPQIYFERLQRGQFSGSYLDFYPSVLEFQPYPQGSFSWHHLWYIPYILVYSFLALPLFLYLQGDKGRPILNRITGFLADPLAIFLFVVPVWISDVLLRPHWPTEQNLLADWANFTFSLLVFVYGFILASDERFANVTERMRWGAFGLGFITVSCLFAFYWLDWKEPSPMGMLFYRLLKDINIWSWLLALLGFARRHLSFTNLTLKYANEAVYPFYILHQTITVSVAYYMTNWDLSPGFKFWLISGLTFAGCAVLYEGVIRRISFLRPFFGLKPLRKEKAILLVQANVGA